MITAVHLEARNNSKSIAKSLNSSSPEISGNELNKAYAFDDTIARFTGLSFESDPNANEKDKPKIASPNQKSTSESREKEAGETKDIGGGSLSVRALISTKEAGVIIGKAGKNVAEIREQTAVRAGVSNVVPGIHERILHVSGQVDSIAVAFRMIAKHLLNNPNTTTPPSAVHHYPNTHPDLTTVRLLIAHQVMGSIIGKGGAKIRELQEQCGAKVVVSKDMLPQSTERIVEIYGTLSGIEETVRRVCQCIIPFTEKLQSSIQYNPSVRLHQLGYPNTNQAPHISQSGSALNENGIAGPYYYTSDSRAVETPPTQVSATPIGRRFGPTLALSPYAASSHFASSGFGSSAAGLNVSRTPAVHVPFGFPTSPNHKHVAPPEAARGGYSVGKQPSLNVLTTDSDGAGVEKCPSSNSVASFHRAPLLTQTLAIPAGLCGCIIGAGGATINQIRQESGSRISISKRVELSGAHFGASERVFTIVGTEKSNEKALYMLYNQLEQEKCRRLRHNVRTDGKGSNMAGTE